MAFLFQRQALWAAAAPVPRPRRPSVCMRFRQKETSVEPDLGILPPKEWDWHATTLGSADDVEHYVRTHPPRPRAEGDEDAPDMSGEWGDWHANTFANEQDLQAYMATHPPKPRPEGEEGPDLSGEWPMAWGLATAQDLAAYYNSHGTRASEIIKDNTPTEALLEKVMSTDLTTVTADMLIDDIKAKFAERNVSGMPVVDEEARLIGVVSKHDLPKASEGAKVADIMSTPPVAAPTSASVKDAAVLMLKNKVHRIPVVDSDAHVVGMVTRTDIFTALESKDM